MAKITPLIVYVQLCLKSMGMGSNFRPPEKKNKCGDPQFISFFLKGKMIVHEIKTKN